MSIPVPGRLADSVRRSVVQVRGKGGSLGSGVVLAPGKVVTNAHVIRGAALKIDAWEGTTFSAVVLKINHSRDLALLSVAGLKSQSLPLGDSRLVKPGMPVFAIGNPMGFVGAVSSGVVHSNPVHWICADVRLAPGNSGGPLTNFDGQVVGINTMVVSNGTNGAGLAFAIPSRAVETFLKHEESQNLGVIVRGVHFRNRFGILVTGIVPASPAERASLLPGDILTGANGQAFTHADDLTEAIDNSTSGLLHLEFHRGDQSTTRQVTATLTLRSPENSGLIRVFIMADSIERAGATAALLEEDERLEISGIALADVILCVGVSANRLPARGKPVVAISSDTDGDAPFDETLKAWLPANTRPQDITSALLAAASGFTVLTRPQSKRAFRLTQRPDQPNEALTSREHDVLGMLAAGLGNKDIAARLNISPNTAKFHVAQIMAKFGATSRTEAVSIAIRRGLVPI